VAAAIVNADPAGLVARLRAEGAFDVDVPDLGSVKLTAEDVVVTETPREGWAVATDAGESVALDLHIDDALRRAGLAREIVRTLQEGRKAAGFDVSDRITVWWSTHDDDLSATFAEHEASIAAEVLATTVINGFGDRASSPVDTELPIQLALARA
jgi:isoleucyl-tRNA synthetase